MKNFLFIILVIVAIVLLWAMRTESYSNGLVFSLGLVATAMAGYLVADYFFSVEKKSLSNRLHVSQKENQALKERTDMLQTQFNTATPHAQVEQLEQRIADLSQENTKIDGIARAQTAEIASLKEKLDVLQKSHSRQLEEGTVSTETNNTQILVLQDTLASSKSKIEELTQENATLREHNSDLVNELDMKMAQESSDTEGGMEDIVSDENEHQTTSETLHSDDEIIAVGRGLGVNELHVAEEPADATENHGSSNNIQAIEGIEPKIADILTAAGMETWEKISTTTPERLRVILDNAGEQFDGVDATSWPEQARFLVHGEFSNLKKYQEII